MYFTFISNTYSCTNNLHKAALKFLQTQDRTLIYQEDLKEYKDFVIAGIKNLNAVNPRCTPIEPYWWNNKNPNDDHPFSSKSARPDDHHLGVGGSIANFHIYLADKNF